MEPGTLSGFENPPFENPPRFEALQAEPTKLLSDIPLLPVGLWLTAGALTKVQHFGEVWGGQAEQEPSCKSGDPD